MTRIYSQEEMEAKYGALPDVLQDALFDDEIANKMYEIGKRYGLSKDNGKIASAEAGNIVLGLVRPDELSSRLRERIGIPEDKAKLLAKDIFKNVLSPLGQELKRAHGFELTLESGTPLVTPTPQEPRTQKPEPRAAPYAARAPLLEPRAREPESVHFAPAQAQEPVRPPPIKPSIPPRDIPRAPVTPPPPHAPLPSPLPPPPPPSVIRDVPRPAPPPMREMPQRAPKPPLEPFSGGLIGEQAPNGARLTGQTKSIEEKEIVFTVPKRPPEPFGPPAHHTTPVREFPRASAPPQTPPPRAPEPIPKNVIMPDRFPSPPARPTPPPAPPPPNPQKIFIPQKPMRDRNGGDLYREPIAPEEKEIKRESPAPYKPEAIYINPKIPPINLRQDQPPAPQQKPKADPDPYREEFESPDENPQR